MKVAYLLGGLPRGGAETLISDILVQHCCAHFDMLCFHRLDGPLQNKIYSAGVPVQQICVGKLSIVSYMRQLRQLVMTEHIDILHAQQALDCLLAHVATIGTKAKVVMTVHGFDYGEGKCSKLLKGISFRLAKKIIFVSHVSKDYYVKQYKINPAKISVVYNGIDFSKLMQVSPLEEELPGRKDVVRLGMVGNFVHGRAQDKLCAALKLVHDDGVPFEFYFIGRHTDAEPWRKTQCENYCREHGLSEVHFLGGRGDVPAILRELDAFVFSTYHDTFGIAVVEALAMGLPTLVNDNEVMREVTRDGKWATLWKTGDANDCRLKIEELIVHIDAYKQNMSSMATEVKEMYSIENHIANLEKVYND